jgi:hypothetical protein
MWEMRENFPQLLLKLSKFPNFSNNPFNKIMIMGKLIYTTFYVFPLTFFSRVLFSFYSDRNRIYLKANLNIIILNIIYSSFLNVFMIFFYYFYEFELVK